MNDFIVELAIRSLILASLGLGLRFALIRFSAQARAKVLTITLISLAFLPLAMLVLPKLSVTVNRVQETVTSGAYTASTASIPAQPMAWGWFFVALAAFLSIRVVYSLVRFHKLEMGLAPASQSLSDRVRNLTQRARVVLFCPEGEPPMTWGVVKPKIALPVESETWIEPQFRSVVLHEEAHIRRKDWAVSIGFRFVAAMYWFNPLVWALKALFEQDSERAADDCVLATGLEAPEYAERLLEIAQALRPHSGGLPAVTMARNVRLKGRLGAILSSKTPRGPILGWKRMAVLGPLLLGAMAAGLVVPITERIPAIKHESEPTVVNALPIENHPVQDLDLDDEVAPPETPVTAPPTSSVVSGPANRINVRSADMSKNVKAEGPKPDCKPDIQISDGQGHTISVSKDDMDEDAQEANEDLKSAMADIKQSFEEARRHAGKEAQEAINQAQKETEQQIDNARKEIEKSDISAKDKGIVKASLNFAKGIAGMSIKMAGEITKGLNINIDTDKKVSKDKKSGQKPPDKKPKAD